METIYILGCGAIGGPLAVSLANSGKNVVAVRTSRNDIPESAVTLTTHSDTARISAQVKTVSLSRLARFDGPLVVTTKSYANKALAQTLKDKAANGPVIILQNGIGVEAPFVDAQFPSVYRCVLYFTSQTIAENEFQIRPITQSPIGIVNGDDAGLLKCIADLSTDGFPFRLEANIRREVWKKGIINSVFNSICPLLEVDNGIFARDKTMADLSRDIIRECIGVTDRLGIELNGNELMEQLLRISKGSSGQLISTLQDILKNRPTEIEFLNLEIARVAAAQHPPIQVTQTELLGKLVLAKSMQRDPQ